MAKFGFEDLVEFLRTQHGEALRWVANYNSTSYDYEFRFVREDLYDDLTSNQLDHVIHRSLAVYNKRHSEEVYFHLGEADYLAVSYDRGTAYHLFLDDDRGVTVMLEPETSVTAPEDLAEWRSHITGPE